MAKRQKTSRSKTVSSKRRPSNFLGKITPAAVLLIAASLSLIAIAISAVYYFTVALPQAEQKKLDFEKEKYESSVNLEKSQITNRETKVQNAKDDLENCLLLAHSDYGDYWETNCESEKKLSDKSYADCLSSRQARYESCKGSLDESFCRSTWLDDKELSCSKNKTYLENENRPCSLPSNRADTVEEHYDENKAECYKKYDLSVE